MIGAGALIRLPERAGQNREVCGGEGGDEGGSNEPDRYLPDIPEDLRPSLSPGSAAIARSLV